MQSAPSASNRCVEPASGTLRGTPYLSTSYDTPSPCPRISVKSGPRVPYCAIGAHDVPRAAVYFGGRVLSTRHRRGVESEQNVFVDSGRERVPRSDRFFESRDLP